MSKSITGRVFRLIVGVFLVAAVASVVPATITDDTTPFGSTVLVGLSNPSSGVSNGTVAVTVVLASGQSATRSVAYRVEPGAKTTVSVLFPEKVKRVEAVAITDSPEPFPQ